MSALNLILHMAPHILRLFFLKLQLFESRFHRGGFSKKPGVTLESCMAAVVEVDKLLCNDYFLCKM